MFLSESQVTLINPQSPIELVSSKRSVTNTVLHRDGRPYIAISTLDRAVSCTQVTDVRTHRLLFTIQRNTIFADTITFEERPDVGKIKINEWMHEVKAKENGVKLSSEWVIKTSVGNYRWRRDLVLRLALYPENGDPESPIAWVRTETHTSNAALVIKHEAEGFMEDIILTFIILELQLRMSEKERATFSETMN